MKQNLLLKQGPLTNSTLSGYYSSVIYEDLQKIKSININNFMDSKYFKDSGENYSHHSNKMQINPNSNILYTKQKGYETMRELMSQSKKFNFNTNEKELEIGMQRRYSEMESSKSSCHYRTNELNCLKGKCSNIQKITPNTEKASMEIPKCLADSRNCLILSAKTKVNSQKNNSNFQKNSNPIQCKCCSSIISGKDKHIELLRELLSKSIKMIKKLYDQIKSISKKEVIISPIFGDSMANSHKDVQGLSVYNLNKVKNTTQNFDRIDNKTIYIKNKKKKFDGHHNNENEFQKKGIIPTE